jgi:hypothetical protein
MGCDPPRLLLAEQIPVIQPLHIHQVVIDQSEIRDTDHGGNQDVENRLPHLQLLLNSTKDEGELRMTAALRSAGALNAGEPIEEPQADRSGDVKNHLADLDLDLTIWSGCRCHHCLLLAGRE